MSDHDEVASPAEAHAWAINVLATNPHHNTRRIAQRILADQESGTLTESEAFEFTDTEYEILTDTVCLALGPHRGTCTTVVEALRPAVERILADRIEASDA